MANLNISLGTAGFPGPENLKPVLEAAKALGIKEIDTAKMYGTNESDLGATGAAELGFVLSTKNPGGWIKGEALKPENLRSQAKESLEKLKTSQVDIFYIHAPDRTLPLSEWVPVINELHAQGVFRRFGVSNFSPDEVRDLHAYCKANGLVLPTVYQGNYNTISRAIETTLFPLLRELGIAFYAYSPIAGGFLTKSRKALENGTEGGRFSTSDQLKTMYLKLYVKPAMLEALDRWEALAAEQGVAKAELAYRWVYYHSALKMDASSAGGVVDNVIIGASKLEQIEHTVEGLKKGPLKAEVVKGIDEIWESVKHEAIVDNFDAMNGSLN